MSVTVRRFDVMVNSCWNKRKLGSQGSIFSCSNGTNVILLPYLFKFIPRIYSSWSFTPFWTTLFKCLRMILAEKNWKTQLPKEASNKWGRNWPFEEKKTSMSLHFRSRARKVELLWSLITAAALKASYRYIVKQLILFTVMKFCGAEGGGGRRWKPRRSFKHISFCW